MRGVIDIKEYGVFFGVMKIFYIMIVVGVILLYIFGKIY